MVRQVSCPHCRRATPYEGNPHRPFCSERCHRFDLGAWASEQYRVPGENLGLSDVRLTDAEFAEDVGEKISDASS